METQKRDIYDLLEMLVDEFGLALREKDDIARQYLWDLLYYGDKMEEWIMEQDLDEIDMSIKEPEFDFTINFLEWDEKTHSVRPMVKKKHKRLN